MSEIIKSIIVLAFNIRKGDCQQIYAQPFIVADLDDLEMAITNLRAEFADADVIENSLLAIKIPTEMIKEVTG